MFKLGEKTVNKALDITGKLVTDKDKKQEIASDIVQNEMVRSLRRSKKD